MATASNLESLIDEHAAAEALAVRVATMRAWRLNGRGPRFVRIGRCVRYRPSVLAQFIADGERRSTSDPGREAN
jgi:hypothetical protein